MIQWILDTAPYWDKMKTALLETVLMLGISLTVSLVFGLIAGTMIYLTQKNGLIKSNGLNRILAFYVNTVRSFPFLIFILIISPLTRLIIGSSFGVYAAAFPLSLIGIALYARLVEQALVDVNRGIIEMALSQGVTLYQMVIYYLISEARVSLVMGVTSVSISLLSYSTVMGAIGGGGIGSFAMLYGYHDYKMNVVFVAVVLMMIFVYMLQLSGSLIAKRIDRR